MYGGNNRETLCKKRKNKTEQFVSLIVFGEFSKALKCIFLPRRVLAVPWFCFIDATVINYVYFAIMTLPTLLSVVLLLKLLAGNYFSFCFKCCLKNHFPAYCSCGDIPGPHWSDSCLLLKCTSMQQQVILCIHSTKHIQILCTCQPKLLVHCKYAVKLSYYAP